MIRSVSFIGAGNVAIHLAKSLSSTGIIINEICSKNDVSAQNLAAKTGAKATTLEKLSNTSDLYIIAIKDDQLEGLTINLKDKLVVHTSGSVSMQVLSPISKNIGVFYPLQTFTKHKQVDFKTIPMCIESSSTMAAKSLIELANKISSNVQEVTSEQRKKLHLAAVFACNFSNHFYSIADEILKESNLSLNLLKPLITETAFKINSISPKEAQTGPAIRKDITTIEDQLNQLKDKPEYRKLYNFVTQSIQNNYE
jgi:predicted short-subunit dehydrogenase-like oxidoreductase (DUF2520 family)